MVEQHGLRPHHVANGDDGKAHGIRLAIRPKRFWPGRAHAAANHIGADDTEAIGINGLAGANHARPPAGLARNRVR